MAAPPTIAATMVLVLPKSIPIEAIGEIAALKTECESPSMRLALALLVPARALAGQPPIWKLWSPLSLALAASNDGKKDKPPNVLKHLRASPLDCNPFSFR